MLEILRKFFRFCDERERSEFYRSIVLGVLAALFSALKIPAIGVMLQAILVEGVTAKTILLSLAVMLISVIGSSILKYRATALQTDGGYSTTANKRVQIAEHLRYLPMGYFNENSLGAITSVTTNTMDNLSGVSTRVVMLVTEGIFSTAVMTLAVFLFDWRVGLFIIAGLAVYYAVNHALQIRSEQTTRRKFAGDTAVVEQVLEFIKGIAEVKSYSLIGRYNRRLEDTIEENVNANTDMELKLLPLMLTQNVVAKLIDMGVVVLSLILYTGGRMELLNCVMLCICSFLLTEGLEQAGTQSSLLRVVDTCVDQAADILDLPAMDISGAELTPEHHDLHADHITFSYGEKQIIHGVTLDIPERTTTAIVGPSGGGKTTLCHLLSRFWDVDAGQVTLGGHDVREYDMDSLMRNFSFVFQNVYLFHDTIANNICFGQPDAPIEQVIAAAKKARCHDFIMKLPQGYDTVIGEAGGSLSVGDYIIPTNLSDAPAAENAYLYNLDGSQQAISVSIKSFAEGLSGKLQSGDIVSVIAPDYKQQGQTVVPAELQYVEVISVTASSGYDANTGEPAADEEDDKELPDTVTLLVSPEQAKVLAELEAEGTIHLSLVYRGDRENAGKFLAAQNDILLELYPPEPDPEEEPQKNPAETDPAADPGETTETEAPAGPEEVA